MLLHRFYYFSLSLSLTALADAVYEVGDAPLREAVESLGGWPVLDFNWESKRSANWTLEVVLGRLRGIHNTPLLVETFVAADDKNSSMNVIQVSRRFSPLILRHLGYIVVKQLPIIFILSYFIISISTRLAFNHSIILSVCVVYRLCFIAVLGLCSPSAVSAAGYF